MSREIDVKCEVRDMGVMEATLDQLGYNYSRSNTYIKVARQYHDIVIKEGSISCDDMDSGLVDEIKQSYTVNFYREQAIREGMQFHQETLANGEIRIRLTR